MQSGPIAEITLRPIEPADQPFLLELYAATRAEEMALVPWPQDLKDAFVRSQFAAQQSHYQKVYPDATHEIILSGAEPVGTLHVARLISEIRIVDLVVRPDRRKQGIGTKLVKRLQVEAGRAGKPLKVYLEFFNSQLPMFERLGFVKGETPGMHVLMEWSPDGGSALQKSREL